MSPRLAMRCMVGNWEESSRERRTGVHGVSSRRRPRLEKKKKKMKTKGGFLFVP
jgi:hypothetical protein